jgi:starvation-inducible outer membrane lipoprotein
MKILLTVVTIASILFLSSCKETNEKPTTPGEGETQTKQPKEQTPPDKSVPTAGLRSGLVEEVIHTTSYTYLRVKETAGEIWIAVPKVAVKVGETVSYKDIMPMKDFKSKELKRTFELVYFAGGVGRKQSAMFTGSSSGSSTKAPPANVAAKTVGVVEGGVLKSTEGVHTGTVEEAIDTTSYTYVRVKKTDVEIWIALPKKKFTIGETISFSNPMRMSNFKSKELNKIFKTVYFVSGVNKASDASNSKAPTADPHAGHNHAKPVEEKKPVEDKKISVEKVAGGISIGELIAKRSTYGGKVISIRGEVVKISKSIMGRNWVHLQDGTGEKGTNDLLVTTQQVVAVGDVVTFQGMIVLNKDFGAGYSYEVLMEKGKQTK